MDTHGSTGQKCTVSGLYEPSCGCIRRIALSRGDTFPPCRNCSHAVRWRLVIAA
jgi:hypothetical protein